MSKDTRLNIFEHIRPVLSMPRHCHTLLPLARIEFFRIRSQIHSNEYQNQYPLQLKSLSLTAPLFAEAYRCCVNQRHNDSDINDCGA